MLNAEPNSHLVGVDFSDAMLALARGRLSRFGPRVLLVAGDLSEPDAIELPDLPYLSLIHI